MRYLRTRLATEWEDDRSHPPGVLEGVLRRVLPEALPDYELHRVREWLVEFDDDGLPGREVGLDERGHPVLAGPDDRNYGFWLDTNMRFDDFTGEDVSANDFESAWRSWQQGSGFGRSSA